MGQWAKEGGVRRRGKVKEMMRENMKEGWGQGNGRFWRVKELSLGLIWREFQPSRILADNTCPVCGQEKGQGMPLPL